MTASPVADSTFLRNRPVTSRPSPQNSSSSDEHTKRLQERWRQLVTGFLVHLNHREASDRTIDSYRRDLDEWTRHLTPGAELTTVLKRAGESYVAALCRRGNGPRTLQRRIACLKSFSRFLVKSGALSHNPFDSLETPRAPQRPPKFWGADQVQVLLDAATDPVHRLIITLFIRCGLRISEMQTLQIENVLRGPKQLIITMRGDRHRKVPLRDDTLALIENHMARLGRSTGWLFPSRRRRGHPVSVSWLRSIVYRYTSAVGIRLHPHALRNSFVIALLEQEVDPRTIQDLLGQTSLSTMQRHQPVNEKSPRDAIGRLPF